MNKKWRISQSNIDYNRFFPTLGKTEDPIKRGFLCLIFVNLLDELIRQVTINCAERGLLLLRVRDEIRMTIAAYQTLYESSVAFGMRKALQAEQGKADMERKVRSIAIWQIKLQTKVISKLSWYCRSVLGVLGPQRW